MSIAARKFIDNSTQQHHIFIHISFDIRIIVSMFDPFENQNQMNKLCDNNSVKIKS